ncbi:MAG: hypothetical protein JWN97_1888 [Nocardioides sp.]|nr:hypothetical protein [Nocardioides sp.]
MRHGVVCGPAFPPGRARSTQRREHTCLSDVVGGLLLAVSTYAVVTWRARSHPNPGSSESSSMTTTP